MATHYERDEEERLVRALRTGRVPRCPRCGAAMGRQAVPPRPGVPYVRTRVWLVCHGCGRSVVLDARRIGEGP